MQKVLPFTEVEEEIIVLNSRFIASLSPAATVEEARVFIQQIKARYPDASHHVPAFVIGSGSSVTAHCSDDGEPSGTAGRPALAVLQGSGIGDTVVVVTRYFGGTKLGKGGLVRAYGDAVRNVLAVTPLARIVQTDVIEIKVAYPHYEPVKRLLAAHQAMIEEELFTEDVTLFARVLADHSSALQKAIIEITAGRAWIVPRETGQEFRQEIPGTIFEFKEQSLE